MKEIAIENEMETHAKEEEEEKEIMAKEIGKHKKIIMNKKIKLI